MPSIPFFDLKAQYHSIQEVIDRAIQEVVHGGQFLGATEEFEKSFSQYIGVKHCIPCANGTDAIQLALQALGIGWGDEVIVPALSWIATSGAVSATGAVPVFVDIDEYFCIDVSLIEQAISPKTKAIIPVHLYGQMADMPAVLEIAKQYNLKIIEDCAQAVGASFGNKKAGSWGDLATFSFYPTKNLGAYGDAGAILTNHDGLAENVRKLANLGQLHHRHEHPIEGYNSRMDTLQANILLAKLPFLEQWNEQRRQIASKYQQELKGVELPKVKDGNKHIFHLYVVRSTKRQQLQTYLERNGIATSIHYPKALPMLPCYAHRNLPAADYPKAIKASQEVLSLPLYPELEKEQVEQVIQTINRQPRLKRDCR